MSKVTSMYEAIDTLQEGIDCAVTANATREGTTIHTTSWLRAMDSLEAVKDFLLNVKTTMGDFAINEDLLGAKITHMQILLMDSIMAKYDKQWLHMASPALGIPQHKIPNYKNLTVRQADKIIHYAKHTLGIEP